MAPEAAVRLYSERFEEIQHLAIRFVASWTTTHTSKTPQFNGHRW